jgi:hypothetical protein
MDRRAYGEERHHIDVIETSTRDPKLVYTLRREKLSSSMHAPNEGRPGPGTRTATLVIRTFGVRTAAQITAAG